MANYLSRHFSKEDIQMVNKYMAELLSVRVKRETDQTAATISVKMNILWFRSSPTKANVLEA